MKDPRLIRGVRLRLVGACIVCLWAAPLRAAPGNPVPFNAAEVYNRAEIEFLSAFYLKPNERQKTEPAFKFAPIILQAVDPGRMAGATRVPGTLSLSNAVVVLDCSRPVLYVGVDSVLLNGKAHPRFTYVWCYSAPRGPGVSPRLLLQGVRVTLNSSGAPTIWEVLSDSNGAELLFVSESLELAAKAQFGHALPGRRYAIERATNQAPTAIVARVIEDGPVAMGPILYFSARTHSVSTLICRCMPAQVKRLVGSASYRLFPLDAQAQALLDHVRAGSPQKTAFWPGKYEDQPLVKRYLRLPHAF